MTLTYADCCHLKATLGANHSCPWCMPATPAVERSHDVSLQASADDATDDDRVRKSKQTVDSTVSENR